MLQESEPRARLDSLTEKQRLVLNAIADHKSSKEIARELGISPSTVEQRLNGARLKLGTRDRGETIRVYRDLLITCEEIPYGFSHVAPGGKAPDELPWEQREPSRFELRDSGVVQMPAPWMVEPEAGGFLEVLDAKLGTIGRPILILAMAVSLALVFLLLVSAVNVLQAVL